MTQASTQPNSDAKARTSIRDSLRNKVRPIKDIADIDYKNMTQNFGFYFERLLNDANSHVNSDRKTEER
jgi:hypothetical protein